LMLHFRNSCEQCLNARRGYGAQVEAAAKTLAPGAP
jgi:hypothetical protein